MNAVDMTLLWLVFPSGLGVTVICLTQLVLIQSHKN